MMPFLMRCLECNEFIPAHRSFNAKKEDLGERYLGIKIYRFLIFCPQCNNVIRLKTSPQTAEMVPDGGGVKNFELKKRLKKTSDVKEGETEEELFQRLEQEEEENKRYQEALKKRKLNPFWQKEEKGQEGFEQRISDQMRQQQQEEDLVAAMDKMDKYQQSQADLIGQAEEKVVDTEAPIELKTVIIKKVKSRSNGDKESTNQEKPILDQKRPVDNVTSPAIGVATGYDSDSD